MTKRIRLPCHRRTISILIPAPLFTALGCIVPLAVYHSISRLTIVDRLREAE